ncbi:MAG: PAS domain S-box protein [Magnetococcales bacterium]|nr:PAS domain S-box protein [Magnetococcales bacterium]
MPLSLSNLIDIAKVQSLADAIHQAAGIPIGIIDLDNNILAATGWQEICTRFHRVHPETTRLCHLSDAHITSRLRENPATEGVEYKCANGLWDIAIPIRVDGHHLATCFLGQFLYEGEAPEWEFFRRQAEQYGFDQERYLDALRRVPVFSREKVQAILAYNRELIGLLSSMGMASMRLKQQAAGMEHMNALLRAEMERRLSAEVEQERFFELTPDLFCILKPDGGILRANQALATALGHTVTELLALPYGQFIHEEDFPATLKEIQRLFQGGSTRDFTLRLINRAGQLLVTEWSATSDGQVLYAAGRDMTAHHALHRHLAESERRLAESQAIARMGNWEWLVDEDRVHWSEEIHRIYQIDPSEPIHYATVLNKVHPDDREHFDQVCSRWVTAGHAEPFRYRIVLPDGTMRHLQAMVQVERNADGRVIRLFGTAQDVTDATLAARKLKENEKLFRTIFEQAGVGVALLHTPSGRFARINRRYAEMVGYSVEELICKGFQEITHPDDLPADLANIRHMISGKLRDFTMEKRYIHRNGSVVWVRLTVSPLWKPGDPAEHHISVVEDITLQKMVVEQLGLARANLEQRVLEQTAHLVETNARLTSEAGKRIRLQQELLFERDKLYGILQAMDDRVYIVDQEFYIKYINPTVEKIHGPLTGEKCHAYLHQFDTPCPWCKASRVFAGESIAWEWHSDKTGRTFDRYEAPLRSADERIGMIAFLHDITNAKRTEKALRESEERYRSLFESAPDAIFLADPHSGLLLDANTAACRMTGRSLDEIQGLHFSELHPPDTRKAILEPFREHAAHVTGMPPNVIEATLLRKDGRVIPVEITGTVHVSAGKPVLQGVFRDISIRKEAEEGLRLREEILNNMAEGVALIRASDGIIVYANPKFETMFGYAPKELIGQNIVAINAPTDHSPEETAQAIITALSHDRFWRGEVLNRRKDGSTLWCDAVVTTFEHRQYGIVWQTIHQDITERKKAEQFRLKNEQRLRLFLELDRELAKLNETEVCLRALEIAVAVTSSEVGYMHIVNEDQESLRQVTWNRSAQRLCQTSCRSHYPLSEAGIWADAIRQRCTVIHNDVVNDPGRKGMPEGHFLVRCHMSTPVMRGEKVHMIIGVGNKGLPYDANDASQLELAANEVQLILSRWRDQETIKLARAQAESANRAKGDFLAAMSHEIRTPMNVVLGMADMLLETDLTAHQRHFAQTMHQSGKTLLGVINDILDFSRIEAGRIEMANEPYSPRQVVEETTRLMRIAAEQKGLAMDLVIDEGVPEAITGDDNRVRQVLINLLGNAVKFTQRGRITVRLARDPERANGLAFEVADTGIGIPLEQQEHIFEQFIQADSGISRRYGGTGLGLAISHRLVGLMGGTIRLRSMPGEGSVFSFFLPATTVVPTPCRNDLLPEPDPAAVQRGMRILLAEDVEENRLVIEAYLMKTPHQLVMVNDGMEAVERTAREAFDVVFMDVQMPRMDGYTATRRIRERERATGSAPMPIIALSAHAMEGEQERSREAGCDFYLSKPIGKKALLEALQWIVSPRRPAS